MKQWRRMKIAIMLAGVALWSTPLASQEARSDTGRTTAASVTGTWRLVAARQRMTDGTVRPEPALGARPSGYMILDVAAGRMCTVINNGDRPTWKDGGHPTPAEVQAIWTQTVSYCATWTVDPAGREFVYRLELSLSPNAVGSEGRRRFSLAGDRLYVYPTPLPPGVAEWAVEWQRVPREAHRP